MRQRKVKNIDQKLAALSDYMIESPHNYKGKWHEFFGNDNPIYLEIGCGKGQFIYRHASSNSDMNYVAVEGQDSVAIRAAEKAKKLQEETGAQNLKIVCSFLNDIGEIFDEGELAGVYLNFSDPWPKDRHKKRRLTYRDRLRSYMKALADGGFIEIKTDNESLFAFTKEEMQFLEWEYAAYSDDLHSSDIATKNDKNTFVSSIGDKYVAAAAAITTEYEDKFKSQGLPIHYIRIEK